MNRPRYLEILTLITAAAITQPAVCQVATFTIEGAAVYRTESRVFCVQSSSHDEYGTCESDAPGFADCIEFGNTPRVTWAVKLAADGSIGAATLDFHSAPPGASCPWPNAPGASWIPRSAEPFLVWSPLIVPSIYTNFPPARGADAAIGTPDAGFDVAIRGKVDDLFAWWASGGTGGEAFCAAMGMPETFTAYLHVSPVYRCEPFVFGHDAWILDERVDFTIRLFATEPPHADLDRDGAAGAADIFVFLAEWFAGRAAGDWDGSGGCQATDIFAFLVAWLSGV